MVGPEMLVAAAVNQVARKINEVIGVAQGEVKLCCSFGDDLESIKDTLVYLEGLLKNAENNSFGSERANLRHWLGQIKCLAYDIEDIVDGYYSSKEQYEGSSYAQKVTRFWIFPSNFLPKLAISLIPTKCNELVLWVKKVKVILFRSRPFIIRI